MAKKNSSKTNLEHIQKLSIKELASMLIKKKIYISYPDRGKTIRIEITDRDQKEMEEYLWFECPNGNLFKYEDDAIEHTVKWLKGEYVKPRRINFDEDCDEIEDWEEY